MGTMMRSGVLGAVLAGALGAALAACGTVSPPENADLAKFEDYHKELAKIDRLLGESTADFSGSEKVAQTAGDQTALYRATSDLIDALNRALARDSVIEMPKFENRQVQSAAKQALDAQKNQADARLAGAAHRLDLTNNAEPQPSDVAGLRDETAAADAEGAAERSAIARAYTALNVDPCTVDIDNGGLLPDGDERIALCKDAAPAASPPPSPIHP